MRHNRNSVSSSLQVIGIRCFVNSIEQPIEPTVEAMWPFHQELLLWLSTDVARVAGVVGDTVVGIDVIPTHQLANA